MGYSVTKALPDCVSSKVKAGVNAAAEKWHLELPSELNYGYNLSLARFGNHPLAKQSLEAYDVHLRQLHRYLAIIGDYESMLMLLLPPTTEDVPSIRVHSLEQFLRLKRTPKNVELMAMTGEPILDVDGGQVFCDGGWNQPDKVCQFRSAVTNLHKAHDQDGTYLEPCTLCVKAAKEEKKCVKHSGSYPRVARCGNPTRNQIFDNTIKQTKKDGAGYIEKGDSQLLPSDLRALRTHLLSTTDLIGLQTWTIVLLGCKLFLRPDEVLSLSVDSVPKKLVVVVDGHVHSITFTVMGKADKKPVNLVAWADDDYPDMCPVRTLLVYLHAAGIKKGWLFPKAAELLGKENKSEPHKLPIVALPSNKKHTKIFRPGDGHFRHCLEYATFLRHFKTIAKQVIPTEELRIGLHCMRKTAYLLAVWGDGDSSVIRYCARHLSEKNSATYRRDADVLRLDARIQGDPNNAIGTWLPCRRDTMSQPARMHIRCPKFGLIGAAQMFVEKNIGFPSDSPYYRTPSMLMEAAMQIRRASLQNAIEFAKELGLDDAKSAKLAKYIQLSVYRDREQQQAIGKLQKRKESKEAGDSPGEEEEAPAKKMKIVAPSAVEPHDGIGKLPFGAEKINRIVAVYEGMTQQTEKPSQAVKTFVSRCAKPLACCLQNHHGGDIGRFVIAWRGQFKMKFGPLCCKGEGDECAVLGGAASVQNQATGSTMVEI